MRIFKHKRFSQWARKEGIADQELRKAVQDMLMGNFEANLGGGLYKKRVPRKGQGKSSGYRTLIAFKREDRSIFIFGFAKNERSNIGAIEQQIFKKLAKDYLNASPKDLDSLIKIGELFEVTV